MSSAPAPAPAHSNCCAHCGTRWPDPDAPWPRTCQPTPPDSMPVEHLISGCGKTTWKNLVPVAVLVVPLSDLPGQYLGVRRAIQPARGEVTLPSGFMEAPLQPLEPADAALHWKAEAARELREETCAIRDPATFHTLHVTSAPSNPVNLLLFVETPPLPFARLVRNFVPNDEVSELVALDLDSPIPWSTHRDAIRAHLDLVARATELILLRQLRDAVLIPESVERRARITALLHDIATFRT